MNRTRLAILVLLCALAASPACAPNPADDKPAAVVVEPAAAPPPPPAEGDAPAPVEPAAEGRTFVIGGDSKIGWTGSKVTGSHEGGFEEFQGTVTLVDGDPTKSSVKVTIHTPSIWSDNSEKLTPHLKSADFFGVETHPEATFESTAIEQAADGYQVTGNLTLHGVNKTISFPAQIAVAEDRVTANAEFSINRMDFGIVYKGKADDLIREEVVIRLDVEALPEAQPASAPEGEVAPTDEASPST